MPSTGAPITRTSPVVGFSSPVIMLSVVDLPQPVGPTTATNSPLATDMLKSRNAIVALPSGETKRHDTESNSITGASLETTWFIWYIHGSGRYRCIGSGSGSGSATITLQ